MSGVGRGGRRARIPLHAYRLCRKLRFLPRMAAHELPGLVLVVALVRALVDVVLLPRLPVEVSRLLGVRERVVRWILHVVDPLPLCEQAVRLGVVRLPERATVRRERKAADLDLVAD